MPYAGRQTELLYNVWRGMMRRCYDESRNDFTNYGARGIEVCREWFHVDEFRDWALENGWQHGLQLDRIDNSGPYSPANCRFLTPKENSRNRRSSVLVTALGETKSIVEWLEDPRCAATSAALYHRIADGWDSEQAVLKPSRSKVA